jgi:hypothetical protein
VLADDGRLFLACATDASDVVAQTIIDDASSSVVYNPSDDPKNATASTSWQRANRGLQDGFYNMTFQYVFLLASSYLAQLSSRTTRCLP